MRNTKRAAMTLVLIMSLFMAFTVTGCKYDVPEGYTDRHHTYEELVEFAKKIDPDATVEDDCKTETYQYREYKTWPAVINGVACHVASVQVNLYNTDFFPGEFAKRFYKMDTDYDYYVINECLKEHDLGQIEDNLFERYNKILYGALEAEPMTEEELQRLWDEHNKVISELEKHNLRKSYRMRIKIGGKEFWGYGDEETLDWIRNRMKEAGVLK